MAKQTTIVTVEEFRWPSKQPWIKHPRAFIASADVGRIWIIIAWKEEQHLQAQRKLQGVVIQATSLGGLLPFLFRRRERV